MIFIVIHISKKYDIRNLNYQESIVNYPNDNNRIIADFERLKVIEHLRLLYSTPNLFVYQSHKVVITHHPYTTLKTYYPLNKDYLIGHSVLKYSVCDIDGYVSGYKNINKRFNSDDYNLLIHNCSDSTKEALEKYIGIKYDIFYL